MIFAFEKRKNIDVVKGKNNHDPLAYNWTLSLPHQTRTDWLYEMWILASGWSQMSSQRIGLSWAELKSAGATVKGFLTELFWPQFERYFRK